MMTYAPFPDSKIYDRLLRLKESFGLKCNRRDRAVVLIGECIEEGFDTRFKILKGTRVIGLSQKHVVGLLDENTGTVPGIHLWRLDDRGYYHLLDLA